MHTFRTIWCLILFFKSPFIYAQGLINNNAIIIQKSGNIGTQYHFQNSGKYLQLSGSFLFTGLGNLQKLKGDTPIIFNRLYIDSGSNALIESAGHTVKNIIKSDGLLQANNSITLLSNVNTTAVVDGSGLGEITGNLTFQSYLANGYGYKYLGSPFQSATVNELANFVNLAADFPSVFKYNEDLFSNGWVNYMGASNLLEPMRGYAFQFGNNNQPKTISMKGVVNNGNISLNINNNNKPYTNGFHLVSNPYPSPINWDESLGWTKVNIDNALYFFDTDEQSIYTGVYNTYINGISSNGLANNFIPPMQAFFVRVSDGVYPVIGNLTVNNKARINHITQLHRKINSISNYDYLRLSVNFANKMGDPLVIYFSSDALNTFSNKMDAIKLMNSSDFIPSIYTFKQKNKLSIQSQPPISVSTSIPIGIQIKTAGEYSIVNTNQASLPVSIYAYLFDSLAKKYIDLKRDSVYKVQLSPGEYNQRFSIVFSKVPITNQLNRDNANTIDDFLIHVNNAKVYITFLNLNANSKTVQVTNLIGQKLLVKKYESGGKYLIDYPFSVGTYIITVWDGNTFSSKKILITH